MSAAQPLAIDVQPAPVVRVSTGTVEAVPTTKPAVIEPIADATVTAVAPTDTKPLVRVNADGTLQYVARTGDTLSTTGNRLSRYRIPRPIAMPSSPPTRRCKADPDRVLAGHAYSMPLPAASAQPAADLELSSAAAKKDSATADVTTDQPVVDATAEKTIEPKTIFNDANGPTFEIHRPSRRHRLQSSPPSCSGPTPKPTAI